jgi:hypothetical protein
MGGFAAEYFCAVELARATGGNHDERSLGHHGPGFQREQHTVLLFTTTNRNANSKTS